MGKLGLNSGYIGSDQRLTTNGVVGYDKYYLERKDGRFLPVLEGDPDAQAFFNRVIIAGGTLSSTEQIAVTQLVRDLKSYNIWSKMKALYPMVGASAAACAQNLKSSSFTGTFNGGITYSSTGITPNGTTGYMDTGLNPNTSLSFSSAHLSKYNRNNDLSGIQIDGVYFAGTATFMQINYTSANTIIGDVGSIASYTATDTRGFFVSSRSSASQIKLFRNNSNIASNTNTVSTIPNATINIGRRSDNQFYNSYECAFASIGDGLTDTEAGNFYTAVNTFQTSLSRNV
jgi:hypothetical protein